MDVARVVAIAAVVLIHVVAPVVSGALGADFTHPRWWLGNVLDSACRAAVPVFVMVSGALMLAPSRREPVREFYRRRGQRIGIPLVFWSSVYLVLRATVLDQDLGPGDALRALATGTPYFHLYFLFVIAGLYLVTPFLRLFVDHAPERLTVLLCLLLLGVGAADQILRSFLGAGQPNAVTYALPFAGYFIGGHLVARLQLSARMAGAAFALSTAATAVGTWFLARPQGWSGSAGYLYSYLSPTVILASISAFVLLRALPDRFPALHRATVAGSISRLSTLSFGVYLVHPALMVMYSLHGPADPLPSRAPALLIAVVTQWLVIVLGALAVTALIRAIPLLRRVV